MRRRQSNLPFISWRDPKYSLQSRLLLIPHVLIKSHRIWINSFPFIHFRCKKNTLFSIQSKVPTNMQMKQDGDALVAPLCETPFFRRAFF